jgi:hypothetical protein
MLFILVITNWLQSVRDLLLQLPRKVFAEVLSPAGAPHLAHVLPVDRDNSGSNFGRRFRLLFGMG